MIPHNSVRLQQEDKLAVQRVLDSGWIGQGPEVEAFERELAQRFRPGGAAACVSSGTAALALALKLAYHKRTVAVPTYACSSLWHAVVSASRTDSFMGSFVDCAPNLTTSAPGIAVHTYGIPCEVPPDAVEDFTHAPGARWGEKPCGSMGVASVISFGATKPLGCGGGGAILGDAALIEEVKDRRDYDGKPDLGDRFNWQMSDLHAAIGRTRLARLDKDNGERDSIAYAYSQRRKPWPGSMTGHYVPYRYVIRVKDPEATRVHFARHDIEVINPMEPWELLHRKLGLDPKDFPVAEDAAAHTISLPIWPGLVEIPKVCMALERLGDDA